MTSVCHVLKPLAHERLALASPSAAKIRNVGPRRLVFRVHAIRRMFERQITPRDVRGVLETGELIEEYPNDTPYPSRLVLGWRGPRPLHVVAADVTDAWETIVITVYEPDPSRWEPGFRVRRQP